MAGQYNIHRTAKQCCEKHFSYININTCEQHSEWSVDIAKETTDELEGRPKYYYPDLYGRDNCVYWNGYYEWMTGAVSCCFIFTLDIQFPISRSLIVILSHLFIALKVCGMVSVRDWCRLLFNVVPITIRLPGPNRANGNRYWWESISCRGILLPTSWWE